MKGLWPERTVPVPSLSPPFPLFFTITHIAWMGAVLCVFTVMKTESLVLLFKAFKHIVPAPSGHKTMAWPRSTLCLQWSVTS